MNASRTTPEPGPNPLLTGLEWHANGWEVTVLRYGTKAPVMTGTTGEDGVALPRAALDDLLAAGTMVNWALRLGVLVVGIDVDNYDAKHGLATLEALETAHGPLPPTWVVSSRKPETGSGIRLFLTPVAPAASDLGHGIEVVRHDHRYVMGPGSIHPDTGEPYRCWRQTPQGWVEAEEIPEPADLPSAPGWLVDLLGVATAVEDGPGVDGLPAGERCAWLERLANPDVSQYSSRHDAYTAAVMNVVGTAAAGHTGATAVLEDLEGRWLTSLEGPRRRQAVLGGEFARMVSTAMARATPATGICLGLECHRDAWLTGAPLPARERQGDPDTSEPATDLDPFRYLITAADLERLDLPPLAFTIPGLLPVGLVLLAGAPKLGKSWLALDLAAAVAAGAPALGDLPTEQGEVLYLALEDGQRRIKDRLGLLVGNAWPAGLHIATEVPTEVPFLVWLGMWLEARPGTRLVVVDTMGRLRPVHRPRDTSAYEQDYGFMASWQRFALTHGITLLAVHHVRKAAADYFVDAVSGTNGIAGAADVVAVLSRAPLSTEIAGVLRVTARDFAEDDLNLARSGPVWSRFDGLVVNPNVGDPMTLLLATVAVHPGSTPTELGRLPELAGWDAGKIRLYLSRAVARGDLIKQGRGRYFINPGYGTL